jgi:hypothetical protein
MAAVVIEQSRIEQRTGLVHSLAFSLEKPNSLIG